MTADIKRIIEVRAPAARKSSTASWGSALTPQIRSRADGAPIDSVTEGSPARRAGIRQGDSITAIGNTPIRNTDDLLIHVGGALAGSEVTLTVRNSFGDVRKATVRLAKFNYPGPVIASAAAGRGVRHSR